MDSRGQPAVKKKPPNKSCQPTPGGRLGCFRLSSARRGCTLRSLYMKPLALILTLLLAISSARGGEKKSPSVVELPRPNSGAFSFQQAEARKSEILSIRP